MAPSFASTNRGSLIIALSIILSILIVPCIWFRFAKRREQKRQERRKEKQLAAIDFRDLEKGAPISKSEPLYSTPSLIPPVPPLPAWTTTMREREMGPSSTVDAAS
ncbi:hypothetical protein PM082_014950 [Marasmius tenuissimus]|nr:hypothetical protein PM082_014950 [Marasmius tenuissimus]